MHLAVDYTHPIPREGKFRIRIYLSDDKETKERGEEMLVMMPTELLEGLLSGLEAQREVSELLEELYYDVLS